MTGRSSRRTFCTVEGCGRPECAKGLCEMHYTRKRLHNSTDDPRGPGPAAIEGEQWLPVPVRGYSDTYEVSDHGRIRRTSTGRVRKPGVLKAGYLIITLSKQNEMHTYLIHRLVAFAFIGPPPTDEHEVNHRDGVKSNCAVSNLEWATKSENAQHAHRTGLHPGSTPPVARGTDHPRAKLSPAAVLAIRASTDTRPALAERYGVSLSAIKAVRRKNSPNWAWLTTTVEAGRNQDE